MEILAVGEFPTTVEEGGYDKNKLGRQLLFPSFLRKIYGKSAEGLYKQQRGEVRKRKPTGALALLDGGERNSTGLLIRSGNGRCLGKSVLY